MPRLGPAFLHEPLPPLRLEQAGAVLAWLGEGLKFWIPTPLRDVGWRAQAQVYAFAGQGAVDSLGILERSRTGDARRVASSDNREDLPVIATLDPRLVYRTRVDLPAEARRSLNRTVTLRLDDVSPIPPAEAAFAVGKARRSGPRRIETDVAIARKATLDAVDEAFAGRRVICIASGDGDDEFIFRTPPDARARRFAKWLPAAAVLWVSLALVGLSLERRVDARLERLEAYELSLREAVRAVRAERDLRETLAAVAPPALRGDVALGAIADALAALPEGSVAESISLENDTLRLRALAPSGADAARGGYSVQRTRSDYSGFDAVIVTAPVPARTAPES